MSEISERLARVLPYLPEGAAMDNLVAEATDVDAMIEILARRPLEGLAPVMYPRGVFDREEGKR